jgi:VanZ family protein
VLTKINLRAPVILLVLSAIAVPVELRPVSLARVDFNVIPSDVLENIAGFLPVGLVLGGLGYARAITAGALLSTLAEVVQLASVHRAASPIDIISNTIGAILGAFISVHWKTGALCITASKWKGMATAVLAFLLVLALSIDTSASVLNRRGSSSPGILEAQWKLDEGPGRLAVDSSGHGLSGKFRNQPIYTTGVLGGAVRLDGRRDYIDFGHPANLRLTGSMTISAWIDSTSFPVDDAAIVSQLEGGLGYQLDTTIDKGRRTIGFKLSNGCGQFTARYGTTPLLTGTWYHVAGVYDANAGTLNVYLNGELDNGPLVGTVTHTQHSSRNDVFIGRRSDVKGYEFAGSIEDVRIYSFALTRDEIVASMRGTVSGRSTAPLGTGTTVDPVHVAVQRKTVDAPCAMLSEPEDARAPAVAAMLGVLIAVAFVCFWPSINPLLYLVMSFTVGFLLPVSDPALPFFHLHLMSLVSLAGGTAVMVSVHRRKSIE